MSARAAGARSARTSRSPSGTLRLPGEGRRQLQITAGPGRAAPRPDGHARRRAMDLHLCEPAPAARQPDLAVRQRDGDRAERLQPGLPYRSRAARRVREFNVITGISDSLGRPTGYQIDAVTIRPIRVDLPRRQCGQRRLRRCRATSPSAGRCAPARHASSRRHRRDGGLSGAAQLTRIGATRPAGGRDGRATRWERQTDYSYNGRGQLTQQDRARGRRPGSGGARSSTMRRCRPAFSRRAWSGCAGRPGRHDLRHRPGPVRTEYLYLGDTGLVTRERRVDPATGAVLDTQYGYDRAGPPASSTDGPLPGTDDATYNRYDRFGRRPGRSARARRTARGSRPATPIATATTRPVCGRAGRSRSRDQRRR